jgi:outer membrane protein TolC
MIIPTSLVPGEFAGQPPGTYIPVKFGTQYNTSAGLTLKQVLFDGQVFVGLQARQTALNYVRKGQELTEQDLRVNIYKVYYGILLRKTQMDLLNANITGPGTATQFIRDVPNGLGEKLDMDKASVNCQTWKQKS